MNCKTAERALARSAVFRLLDIRLEIQVERNPVTLPAPAAAVPVPVEAVEEPSLTDPVLIAVVISVSVDEPGGVKVAVPVEALSIIPAVIVMADDIAIIVSSAVAFLIVPFEILVFRLGRGQSGAGCNQCRAK